MEKKITFENFGELSVGEFLILRERKIPVDSGVVIAKTTRPVTIDFQSATKKDSKMSLTTGSDTDLWFPLFEGFGSEKCFSQRGPAYELIATDRRIPVRPQ